MQRRRITIWASVIAGATATVTAAGVATAATRSPGDTIGIPAGEEVAVTLTLTTSTNVEQLASAVATPGSGSYGRHLTRDQLRQRVGVTAEQVRRVTRWANKAGFKVDDTSGTGTQLTVRGTASAAHSAFNVNFKKRSVGGVQARTTVGKPAKPSAIAGDVREVANLTENVAQPMFVKGVARKASAVPASHSSGRARPAAASENSKDCAEYWAQRNDASVPQAYPSGMQSNAICGYLGPQLRAMYGLGNGDRGAGQTIAIVGAFSNPNALSDANKAFEFSGVPALPADRFEQRVYKPSSGANGCEVSDWNLEQALDIQAIHTIASDAKIVYIAAPDCKSMLSTLQSAVNDATLSATIISNSWLMAGGEPSDAAAQTAMNGTLATAAVLGIGTYFCSGDHGDFSTKPGSNGASVAFPASSPWTTAVGGTSAGLGADSTLVFQTGWENGGRELSGGAWRSLSRPFVGGAGGGTSAYFDKPSWQRDLPGTKRAVPDISALADVTTGFFVAATVDGELYYFSMGGTSLATPIIAGLVADAQARAGSDTDIGLLAPTLYSSAANGKVVTDVKHVSAGVRSSYIPTFFENLPEGTYLIDFDAALQPLKTTDGYDNVTGLGVPGPNFLTGIVS